MSQTAVTVIILIVLVIGGFFLFQFFQDAGEEPETLVINSEERFDPENLELGNDDRVVIRNDSEENQIVKRGDETVAELEPGQTSGEIEFSDDSNVSLSLENSDTTSDLVVGVPSTEDEGSEEEVEDQNQGQGQLAPDNGGEPLPDTGPDNLFVAPLVVILGALLRVFHRLDLK